MIADSLTNLVVNLAAGNSKTTFDRFVLPTLPDEQLEAMYRGNWIARKIVDLPVTDMTRPWRNWQASPEQITAIEDAEKRHQVRAKITKAMRLARLYGGAAILIGADAADPMAPLNLNAVKKGGLRYLTVVSRRMIGPHERDLDPESPTYGEPQWWTLSSQKYGSIDVHPSRVIRFIGPERPDIDTNSEGWGDSILQVVYSAVHNAALSSASIAELIHEAKTDIVKVKNLGAMLSTEQGTALLTKRFQNAQMLRSINGTYLIDGDDEHSRVNTSFSNLSDVLMSLMQVVSGAADIPITRFLGTSPKGFNSTGESDLINYYDMLDGNRTTDLRPKIEFIDELLWRDATGSPAPKETYFTFGPLWQLPEKDKAEVEHKRAQTSQIYANMGVMPEEALARGIVNQLIENETYPGLEAEIEKYLASNKELVPEDPMEEIEVERAEVELQSLRNAPKGQSGGKAQDDLAPADRSVDRRGSRLGDFLDLSREINDRLVSREHH